MTSNTQTNLQVLDRDELIERMMGSTEMAHRMLLRFIESAQEACDMMESATRIGDASALKSLAHRHKGTAQTMSAGILADLLNVLEKRADSDSVADLLDLVDQIRAAHQEVSAAFTELFSSSEGVEL